jgi:hypothetical protein
MTRVSYIPKYILLICCELDVYDRPLRPSKKAMPHFDTNDEMVYYLPFKKGTKFLTKND